MMDDSSMGNKRMLFMNTQKIPSSAKQTSKPKSKSVGMSSIPKFRGKALDIAQEEDRTTGKPKKKPSFVGLKLDSEEEPAPRHELVMAPPKRPNTKPTFSSIKGEDQNNFANENVMSKSNLRDRK